MVDSVCSPSIKYTDCLVSWCIDSFNISIFIEIEILPLSVLKFTFPREIL